MLRAVLPAGSRVLGPTESLGHCHRGHPRPLTAAAVTVAFGRWVDETAALLRAARWVAVVVTDGTRPTPLDRLLPPLLDAVRRATGPACRIRVVMACGLHPPVGTDRVRAALAAHPGVPVDVHDAHAGDLVDVGAVDGVPVLIHPVVAAADLVVTVGTVMPHAEAGYSGGAKCVVPGVAGAQTIRALHTRATSPLELRGVVVGNGFRGFLESAAALVDPVHSVNAVLHPCGALADLTVGPAVAAHRAAARSFAERYRATAPADAGLAVVGAGGAPFDVDLHQAEGKAWRVGLGALRGLSAVVLVAACPQGVGNAAMAAALRRPPGAEGGDHGGRKARFLRLMLQGIEHRVVVHAGLPPDVVAGIPAHSATDLPGALRLLARRGVPARPAVVLPNPNFVVLPAHHVDQGRTDEGCGHRGAGQAVGTTGPRDAHAGSPGPAGPGPGQWPVHDGSATGQR